jgi:hypothetical protein
MKRLTKKQKANIIRIEIGNLLAQCSTEIFDDCEIFEDEKKELLDAVQAYGDKKLKGEKNYSGSAKQIVDDARKKF